MVPFGNMVNPYLKVGHKVMVQTLQWFILVEVERLQCYQEGWCLFLDAFVEFLTMA